MLLAPNAQASFNDGLGILTRATSHAAITQAALDLDRSFWLHALAHPKKMSGILYCIFWRSLDSQETRVAIADMDEKDKTTLKTKVIAVLRALANGLLEAAQTSPTAEERQTHLTVLMRRIEEQRLKLPATPFTRDAGIALERTVNIMVIVFSDTMIRTQSERPADTRAARRPPRTRPPMGQSELPYWLDKG